MQYKAIALDVDGTLIAPGAPSVTEPVARAVRGAQQRGVKVIVATGRTHYALGGGILGGIRPDYFVCVNGAQVLDAAGLELFSERLSEQEMYALVDFCEDHDYPLAFSFSDAYYVYVEYERMRALYKAITGHTGYVRDGEDQDRHLQGMPYASFCAMPPRAVERFQQRYGHLGLAFVPYAEGRYDVGRPGLTKATGLAQILARAGIAPQELVAVGDAANDVPMLRMAGLPVCMDGGAPAARQAAARIAPSVQRDGVAALVRELFLGGVL